MLHSLAVLFLATTFAVNYGYGLGAETEGGPQPNPIASLLPFVLMMLVVFFIIKRVRRKDKGSSQSSEKHRYRQRPPTDRQMAYIDSLMEEREIEPWMLEKEPETIQEASELIEKLLKRPIRDPGSM